MGAGRSASHRPHGPDHSRGAAFRGGQAGLGAESIRPAARGRGMRATSRHGGHRAIARRSQRCWKPAPELPLVVDPSLPLRADDLFEDLPRTPGMRNLRLPGAVLTPNGRGGGSPSRREARRTPDGRQRARLGGPAPCCSRWASPWSPHGFSSSRWRGVFGIRALSAVARETGCRLASAIARGLPAVYRFASGGAARHWCADYLQRRFFFFSV